MFLRRFTFDVCRYMIYKKRQVEQAMEFFTSDEAAKVLKVAPTTIRKWLRNGEITGADTPAGWRLSEADIQEWINRYRKPTPTDRDKQI